MNTEKAGVRLLFHIIVHENHQHAGGHDLPFLFFLKILLLKRMRFKTAKKTIKIMSVNKDFTGARVARNIIGKTKTIAGKF